MSKTPYPKGLRLDPTEVEFLQNLLLGCAEQARESNNAKMYNTALGLSQRVSQAEMHSEGVPPELQKSLQTGIQRAFESGSPERATRAMENFLATMVRLHPDPARVLAQYALAQIQEAVSAAVAPAASQAADSAAGAIIDLVDVKIQGMCQDYDTTDYPDAEEVLTYLRQWLEVGKQRLAQGVEPWDGDDHVERAREPEQG